MQVQIFSDLRIARQVGDYSIVYEFELRISGRGFFHSLSSNDQLNRFFNLAAVVINFHSRKFAVVEISAIVALMHKGSRLFLMTSQQMKTKSLRETPLLT